MIQTYAEQEQLALQAYARDVGLLCTKDKGKDWTWFVAQTFVYGSEAETWFDNQVSPCRVFSVYHGEVRLIYAK